MKRKKIITILLLATLGTCLSLKTYAKYSKNSAWNYYLNSQGFYISSEQLDNEQKNVNTMWDGGSTNFNIKNNINKNQITDYDIRYSVRCEILTEDIEATCKLNGTNKSTITGVLSSGSSCINEIDEKDVNEYGKTQCEMEGYEWQSLATTQQMYFDIESEENIENIDVKITLNTTSPYTKTLTGIFNLYKNDIDEGTITKQLNNNQKYDELIISNTYETTKCVDIEFNSSKRIVEKENTMSNFINDENGYIKEFKINIESMKNKKIVFYNKNLAEDYTIDDFIVTETTGCE